MLNTISEARKVNFKKAGGYAGKVTSSCLGKGFYVLLINISLNSRRSARNTRSSIQVSRNCTQKVFRPAILHLKGLPSDSPHLLPQPTPKKTGECPWLNTAKPLNTQSTFPHMSSLCWPSPDVSVTSPCHLSQITRTTVFPPTQPSFQQL